MATVAFGILFMAFAATISAQVPQATVYVSDTAAGDVFKFDAAGQRTVFASGLNAPTGLALDNAGNLYVADANGSASAIYKYDSAGAVTLFASGGDLAQPRGLAFDSRRFSVRCRRVL